MNTPTAKLAATFQRFPANDTMQVCSTQLQFWSVVCAIQLASRHPSAIASPSLQIAIQWAREVGAALSANDADLRLLMNMGWEQTCDVNVGMDLPTKPVAISAATHPKPAPAATPPPPTPPLLTE
jgi:hypothetical protein